MKIRIDILLSVPLLLGLLQWAACTREEAVLPEPADSEGVRLELSARMHAEGAPESRVLGDDAAFPAGDYRFGTWICTHNSLPDFVPAKNGYANLQTDMKATADGAQTWTYSFENGRYGTTLNVNHGVPIDIYTFYPRPRTGAQATSPDNVPFTSGQTDWMWAKASLAGDQLTGGNVNVKLEFRHVLTCLRIRIKCNYLGSISLTSITLKDKKSRLYTGGSMNLAEQKLVTTDAGKTDALKITYGGISLSNTVAKDFYIFMPAVEGYADGDFTLSFVFNGNPAKAEFSVPGTIKDSSGETVNISSFETGKRYTYSLTLDNPVIFSPVAVDDNWETIDRELIL